MWLLSETDREYFKATMKSWWFILASVIMGAMRLLEKWYHIGIEIPNWALESFAFLALSLAQFRAYKGLHQKMEKELVKKDKAEFDFRLHSEPASFPTIKMQITPVQFAFVYTPRVIVTVWNKGQNHLQISSCQLSTKASTSPRIIKSDIHIHPAPAEAQLDITQELAELVFVHKDWQKIGSQYQLEIAIDCEGEDRQPLKKAKVYEIGISKPAGFNLAFAISAVDDTRI